MKDKWVRKEDKPKKNYWAIIFLAFIIIGLSSSFVFFGFGGSGTKVRYGDHAFTYKGEYWSTKIDGVEAAFTYPPDVVDFISVTPEVLPLIAHKYQYDVTSEANDTFTESIGLAQFQLGATLNNYGVYVRPGFTLDNTTLPQITCQTATPSVPVLYFAMSNTTEIFTEDNCVHLKGRTHQEMIMVKDRLLYTLLGVME